MTSTDSISEYHKVVFETSDAAEAAAAALTEFVTHGAAAMMTLVGPNRVVLWDDGSLGHRMRTLYLSRGALLYLQRLALLPNSEVVHPQALPVTKALRLGEDCDWDCSGGRDMR
jgi:hypothetical protein